MIEANGGRIYGEDVKEVVVAPPGGIAVEGCFKKSNGLKRCTSSGALHALANIIEAAREEVWVAVTIEAEIDEIPLLGALPSYDPQWLVVNGDIH